MKSRRRNREVGEFVVVDVRARVPLSSVKKGQKGKDYIYVYMRLFRGTKVWIRSLCKRVTLRALNSLTNPRELK